jgi:phospho-N-acetylmuramoyl-pentapeptide-transferase
MLYYFLYPFSSSIHIFNVLRYPSFRIGMAALTAGLITLIFYPLFIKKLTQLSFGQSVREDGPKSHIANKTGTPTMGGALVILAVFLSCMLWGDLTYKGLWLMLFVCISYGCIGLIDDLKKIFYKNSKGISAKAKMFWQVLLGLIALIIYSLDSSNLSFSSNIAIPFIAIDKFYLPLPVWFYIAFALFIIVGTSNAVNLTDGLDGLAIMPIITSSMVFLVLAYVAGSSIGDLNIADYLKIPKVLHAYELSVFCAALAGAGVGFLWYNTYPATIFMGDVGSLSFGASLGMLAILTKNELISALLHGVFLIETISVLLQVISFKLTKKRIFKMAPIHHHFELLGLAEPKVIVRFWIVAALLGLLTLLSLKVR